ncbi:dihydrolipoamide acetyltransferase family protein [Paeniglutamicibacter sp.]|uniref:dihydrolipoamide acetyltransferase family protein n=1 Tax=Paeniglutamicibacter sp. TaxID=1934391 RepID=UPI003988AA26
MATLITMPAIVADATDAVLAAWLVQIGTEIVAGAPLADIETEKATVELASETTGRVARLLIDAGAQVAVGSPIAVIAAPGDSDKEISEVFGEGTLTPVPKPGAAPTPGELADPSHSAKFGDATNVAVPTRQFASPLARRLAKESGIDLATLAGRGPNGRILRSDVESAVQETKIVQTSQDKNVVPSPMPARKEPTKIPAAGVELVPMSRMRQAIARRLTESKTTVPHFYLSADVHLDKLLEMRKQANASANRKITVNDLIVRTIALALQQVPDANVAFAGNSIARHEDSDISVAIATEGGLITPIVRAAQSRSISHISATIADFVARAQENRIRPDEISGGTFTVSNLGMFGTKEFSAILNPPQSGILAVGAAEKRAVVVDDELAIATVMTCTLSADHRVIDGAVAARLMAKFKELLENPLSILL